MVKWKSKFFALCLTVAMSVSLFFPPISFATSTKNDTTNIGNPNNAGNTKKAEFAPDRVLVKFKTGVSDKEKETLKKDEDLGTFKKFILNDSELVKIKKGSSVDETLKRLKNNSKVLYAQPDYKVYSNVYASDPYFNNLWGLNNYGQTDPVAGTGTPDVDIDAPEAWDINQGSSDVIVAVIDTGCDISHPDLAPNIWKNEKEIPGDGIDNDGNGYVDDVNGWDFWNNENTPYDASNGDDHGTHTSGTIAAAANNGIGVAGVAPKVKIMPLKFIGPSYGYTSGAMEAMQYAKQMGAQLASNSWGSSEYEPVLKDAITSFGRAFIASAGNSGANADYYPSYPAAYDCSNIISVAAVANNGLLPMFTNYGPRSVDVGAPGVNVYSTLPGSDYGYYSGTSMAAPHVSGVVALMLSVNPNLSPDEIVEIVRQTTKPLDSLQGKCVSGGMVNAKKAVDTAKAIYSGAPYVLTCDPANNSIGVPASKNFTITFTKPVVQGSNFNGITLKENNITSTPYTASLADNTLTIVPTGGLNVNSSYTLSIPTNALQDSTGSNLAVSYTEKIFTLDTIPPQITYCDLYDGATIGTVSPYIRLNFSEPVSPGPNPIIISDGTKNYAWEWIMPAENEIHILLPPGQELPYATNCTMYCPIDAFKDGGKNYLSTPLTINFKTLAYAPSIVSTSPANGAVDVKPSSSITVKYDQNCLEEDFSKIKLTKGITVVECTYGGLGNQFTLTPKNALDYNTKYTVTIEADAVSNGRSTLLAPYTFSFTTTPLRPEITSTDPPNGATGVPLNKAIVLNFNCKVLGWGSGGRITISDGTSNILFNETDNPINCVLTPVNALKPNTTYTVTVRQDAFCGITNYSFMAAPYTFTFTTTSE